MNHTSKQTSNATEAPVAGFRLSPQQQRLWELHQAGAPYRIRASVAIEGALDAARLRHAAQRVAESREILRTTFACHPGSRVPLQAPAEGGWVWDEDLDRSSAPDADDERGLEQRESPEIERYAGWEHCSALRLKLVRLGDAQHRLLLDLHPLCGDGSTAGLLIRAIAAAYTSLPGEQPAPYEGLQYFQFAEWQNSLLETPDEMLDEAQLYWSSRPAQPAASGLPMRRELPSSPGFAPERVSAPVAPGTVSEIVAAADRLEVTEAEFLYAAWCAFVWRWSEHRSAPIGFVSDGRSYDELRAVMGLIAKCLPLEPEMTGALPFSSAVAGIQARLREALEWQDYFLFAPSAAGYDKSPSALETAFEYEERAPISGGGELAWTLMRQDVVLEPFQLKLGCVRDGETLTAELVYDAGLYDRSAAERLLRGWLTLARDAAQNPEQRVDRLNLLDDAERTELLIRGNETDRPYPETRCFHDLFEEQAARTPEAIAVRCGASALTYRELDERARRLAALLADYGVAPESRVALCLNRSPELLVAILGILKAGGAYVPLDTSYPLERLSQILEDAGPAVILTESALEDALPASLTPIICLDTESLPDPGAGAAASARPHPQNLAYVIYTSGSTGKPKGVMIPHQGLVNYLHWCAKTYQVSAGSGTLVDTPVGFDLTVTSFLSPLVAGQTAVLLPEESGVEALAEALQTSRDVTLVKTTPAHLEMLRNLLPDDAAHAARLFVIGGEALRWETLSFWRSESPETRLVNEYGPTETVVGCCVYEVPDAVGAGSAVPIGRPIANTRLYLLDSALQPVPMGMPGELYVGGVGVARGYLERPDLTAERFVPDAFGPRPGGRLYKTGDLCRTLPDGNLEYLGRTDHQVKIRGFRIELGEIESVLAQHRGVREVVALAREDHAGDRRLVAYVVADLDSRTPEAGELQSYVAGKLPEYMVPSAFVFLDALPLTPNRKVDRGALPPPDGASPMGRQAYVAPRTPIEEALAEIWSEVLGAEDVGIHDDFFELGGHSLLATQVISRVRQLFQVSAPLRWLFDAPTVASFSGILLSDPETGPRVQNLMDRMLALQELSDEELEERLRGPGGDAEWE